ncbi:MAG: carboxymuconolactone decarboxylase family protein [Gemmatimonadaceae bacterium]
MTPQRNAPGRNETMTRPDGASAILAPLDAATRAIVRLAGAVAALDEAGMRPYVSAAVVSAPHLWVEEVLLQSYLFAGFPRALNAMREWRRLSQSPSPLDDEGERLDLANEWRARGEATCRTVYGPFYDRLRTNIRALHPALDAWMIVEGYGKVLSRPGLDLGRRELCIVAACAASRQDRQLHSHLHGALHAGVDPAAIGDALDSIADLLADDDRSRVALLWARVRPSSPSPTDRLDHRDEAGDVH